MGFRGKKSRCILIVRQEHGAIDYYGYAFVMPILFFQGTITIGEKLMRASMSVVEVR